MIEVEHPDEVEKKKKERKKRNVDFLIYFLLFYFIIFIFYILRFYWFPERILRLEMVLAIPANLCESFLDIFVLLRAPSPPSQNAVPYYNKIKQK